MGKKKSPDNRELVESLLAIPYWQAGDAEVAAKVTDFFEHGVKPVTVKELLASGLELFQLALDLSKSALKANPLTPLVERHVAAEMGVDAVSLVVDGTGAIQIETTKNSGIKAKPPAAKKVAKAEKVVAAPTKNDEIKKKIKAAKAAEKVAGSKVKKEPHPAQTETEKVEAASGPKKAKAQSVPKIAELRARAKAVGQLDEIAKFGRSRKKILAFLLPFENQSDSVEVDEEAEIVDGEKTVTKSASVPSASAGAKGSGGKAAKGFLKTGDAVQAKMREEFEDIEDLLEESPPKKNGKTKKNGKGKKKNLTELVKDAEDLDLNAIIDEDDPDMVDLDAIIGS